MRLLRRRGPVVFGSLLVSVLFWAGAAAILQSSPALAHTDLDFTLPSDGTTVGEPVAEVSIGFTDQVALIGNGFDVHDPQGNLLEPFVVTDDNKVFRLQLDPPLAGGVVGVDYHVRALDGDEMSGSFSFTVAAELPTTTSTIAAPVTTVAPATTNTTIPQSTAASSTVPSTTAPAAASPTATSTDSSSSGDVGEDSKDDSTRNIAIVILVVVALGCAGFVIVRSRTRH